MFALLRQRRQHPDGVRNKRIIVALDEPIHVQEGGDSAHGVGAAAETKHEDAVSRLICAHEKEGRCLDIVLQPVPDGEAKQLGNLAAETCYRTDRFHRA